VFDYEVATGELLLRKRQPVLGGYEPRTLRAEAGVGDRAGRHADSDLARLEALVRRRRRRAPPLAPVRYGSYEHSIEPGFSVPRLSELDRGVIFAVAHVRGGGEMGRQWYEDGKLLHKRNTFTDFVDSALHLIDSGYTSADRMVAEGGSAAGC
jgi:oligopeptidase B